MEFVFQRYQPMLLALLCTPALAVRNFRPTLLRPRAPHLRTAALRPACIALDPDLQPVGDTWRLSPGPFVHACTVGAPRHSFS